MQRCSEDAEIQVGSVKKRNGKSINYGKIIFPILTLAWMILIFSMSAESGQESSGLSELVCRWIGKVFVKGFDKLPFMEQTAFIESISFLVRKAAHMTEYAVLMTLLTLSFASYGKREPGACLISLAVCFVYACTDEFHQTFVGGRAGQFRDVLIDTAGAGIAFLLILLIRHIRGRMRKAKPAGPSY